jgi:hypothetical protein
MTEETRTQTEAASGAGFNGAAAETRSVPTTSVRVLYPDLHGVARG